MCKNQHFKWLVVCSYVGHGVSLKHWFKWMSIWHEALGCVVCELEKNVFISSNHKGCIEGELLNFNYKRNLTSRITLTFFPSLVAFVLQA